MRREWNEQNLRQVTEKALEEIGEYLVLKVREYCAQRSQQMRLVKAVPTMSSAFLSSFGISNEFLMSFGAKVTGGDTIHVGTNKKHAAYLEWGTRPHIIHASEDSVLAWTIGIERPKSKEGWKKAKRGGLAFYAKYVHHPGIPARHFMRDAILDSKEIILQKFGVRIALVES